MKERCSRCQKHEFELRPMGNERQTSMCCVVTSHELLELSSGNISIGWSGPASTNVYLCDRCKVTLLAEALYDRFGIMIVVPQEE